jgi:preprotein translocase subunit SecG
MMEFLFPVVLAIHVIVGLAVIGLVLLQHGKGADMGAAFGSGASGSLFGASGSANFLSRTTAGLATVFFLTSLGLSYLASSAPRSGSSVMDAVKTPPPVTVPLPGQAPPASGAAPATADPAAAGAADSKAKEIPK